MKGNWKLVSQSLRDSASRSRIAYVETLRSEKGVCFSVEELLESHMGSFSLVMVEPLWQTNNTLIICLHEQDRKT